MGTILTKYAYYEETFWGNYLDRVSRMLQDNKTQMILYSSYLTILLNHPDLHERFLQIPGFEAMLPELQNK